MREFAKAADLAVKAEKEAAERAEVDPITFKVRDHEITVDYPGSGQIIYLTTVLGSDEDVWTRGGRLINFVTNLMEEDDRRFISHLLLDKNSGFDHDDIEQIVEYLLEEWSARPTAQPADYLPSRRAGGQSSTGSTRRAASTRSRSTSRASAT